MTIQQAKIRESLELIKAFRRGDYFGKETRHPTQTERRAWSIIGQDKVFNEWEYAYSTFDETDLYGTFQNMYDLIKEIKKILEK